MGVSSPKSSTCHGVRLAEGAAISAKTDGVPVYAAKLGALQSGRETPLQLLDSLGKRIYSENCHSAAGHKVLHRYLHTSTN